MKEEQQMTFDNDAVLALRRETIHHTKDDDGDDNDNDNDSSRRRRNHHIRSLASVWCLLAAIALAGGAWSDSRNYSNRSSYLFQTNGILSLFRFQSTTESSSSWDATAMAHSMVRQLLSPEPAPQQQQQQPEHQHHHAIEEVHKPLFPLTANDYIGFVCMILGLMIAAGGGIGGGGILVPIYSLVMHFSPKHAIALSNVTVFGGAVANALFNFNKRHPLADRPLIDWDLILVMEPLTIGGALLGAFLNKILSEILLLVLLVLLLSFTAYESLKKGLKMYQAENKKMRQKGLRPDGTKASELTRVAKQAVSDDSNQASEALLEHMELQEGETVGEDALAEEVDLKTKSELEQILMEERVVPMQNVMILCSMFVVVLVLNVLKGGGAFPSPLGIKCGSTSFWVANAIMIGWILFISFLVRIYLVKRYELKKRVGYQYVEGDIQWDGRATIVYPCICCLAGFFAGMFGVGGGIVKGPLMLAMGVHPAVSSATSACMILFTCFTATTSYMVFGLLILDYGIACVIIGFLATVVGQVGLTMLMKKNERNSYIVFSIGVVVLLSAFLLTIQALFSIAEGEHHASGGICGKDS